jgi:hypothetical protein
VTDVARKLALAVLLLVVASALVAFVFEGPSGASLWMALFLIVVWTPVKGALYRRLGGLRPYPSALAANAASLIAGLPFHLDLAFWPKIGVSFVVSAALETLALAAIGTANGLRRCLFLGFYASFVVHLITAGWFASQRSPALGVPFIIAGILLFHLPTLFPDTWVSSPQPNS